MHMSAEEFAEEVDTLFAFVTWKGRGEFPYFAQHPTDGFMHQVVGVIEEHFGVAECIGRVTVAGCPPGAYHGDALFPEVAARG